MLRGSQVCSALQAGKEPAFGLALWATRSAALSLRALCAL